jgi:hypothetical protein
LHDDARGARSRGQGGEEADAEGGEDLRPLLVHAVNGAHHGPIRPSVDDLKKRGTQILKKNVAHRFFKKTHQNINVRTIDPQKKSTNLSARPVPKTLRAVVEETQLKFMPRLRTVNT